MPAFSNTSRQRLLTCHHDLQKVFNEVIKHYDCTILQGHRSKEEQDEYYRTGKSKVQYPNSKHNSQPSMAVDVAPWYDDVPHVRWDDSAGFYHFAGFVLGIASQMNIALRWGGDWDGDNELYDQTFMDLPHFELINK